MPVSWEMASGPTVAYKMAGQGSTRVAAEGSKGSNFSHFRVQDALSRGLCNSGDASKGSNYRIPSSHDTVVRGLSALSLRGHYQQDADSTAEESRSSGSLGALCCASPELYRCISPRNNDSLPFAFVPPSSCSKSISSAYNIDFVECDGTCSQASIDASGSESLLHLDVPQRAALCTVYHTSAPSSNPCGDKVFQRDDSHSLYNTLWSSNVPKASMREDVTDLDSISDSSFSSGNCMPAASLSSGAASQASDDTEAESAYKAVDLSSSVGTSFSPRKGLSRFYAGKSRSYSCLSDVASVKDLAKPESPYAKKRKVTSSSSRLPPLQKGSASILKKPLQNGKSTLALAIAMNTKEENESQFSYATPRCQKSLLPSRSYSLSDLQGAAGSLFFIG